MERVLDLGADAGLGLFDRQPQRFQRTVIHLLDGGTLGCDAAPGIRIVLLFVQVFPHAGVAGITVYTLVIVTYEMPSHRDIGHVGRGGDNTMDQTGDGIDADMGLHPEEPLIALLGVLHLRVALLGLVLGGGCYRHDGGVDDRALAHEQALLGQTGVDVLEDPLGQGMFLQQMTEVQQRGRVRHALDGQIDTDEVAHRLTVVDGVERLVGSASAYNCWRK